MASLGLHCCGKALLSDPHPKADQRQQQSFLGWRRQPSKQEIVQDTYIPNLNIHSRSSFGNAVTCPPSRVSLNLDFYTEDTTNAAKEGISSETLDKWMRDSVTEIVRNIGEAPFLVHVFCCDNQGTTTMTRLRREKAVAEMWPLVQRRWWVGGRESSTPDGIILVEELKEDNGGVGEEDGGTSTTTRTWGVLIQGRGINCAPACYILKTCRVVCSSSIGFCTHFYLVRAKCFGESAQIQLKYSWLVQQQQHY